MPCYLRPAGLRQLRAAALRATAPRKCTTGAAAGGLVRGQGDEKQVLQAQDFLHARIGADDGEWPERIHMVTDERLL